MKETKLNARPREGKGSASAGRLRRTGWFPAVVYGEGRPGVDIQLNEHDFVMMLRTHRSENMIVDLVVEGAAKPYKAMLKAMPQLLEPVMNVTIYVDKSFLGDIMSDITGKRGRVLGMTSRDDASDEGITIVKAQVPFAEMLRYSIDLKSMTSNRATFEMNFSHYDPINGRIADTVIESRKKMLDELKEQ